MMNRILSAILGLFIATTLTSATELEKLHSEHPRLLATTEHWQQLKLRLATEPDLAAYHEALIASARKVIPEPALTYQKTGRRLLSVSREAVKRILLLGYAWRTTGEVNFAKRAESEMLAIAAFPDWNPSHFLDVGEATAALAIGYDWLFEALAPTARTTIRQAILNHGLKPGLEPKGNGWQKAENNWNQVCFGGLTLGALAIADDEPLVANAILQLAHAGIHHGLAPYAPDGVYPEGPSYWSYGTSYQVLLIAALESALGTDWNLTASPGFLPSAGAYLQTTGPSGRHFNFSDGSEGATFEPALFWFAGKLSDPGLLQFERRGLSTAKDLRRSVGKNRFAPLAALWWPPVGTAAKTTSLPLRWQGGGSNPLIVFRSSWTASGALYLAAKGGAAELNHAHMDAGSFVFEVDGVRWAIDLGMQDYESLESKGVDLWNRKQDSPRWSVYRLNNFSHNTLTIGGQLHRVGGHAMITEFSADPANPHAVVDLSPVFAGQATEVKRTFRVLSDKHLQIQDRLLGLPRSTEVRWQMATRAEVTLTGSGATLRQEGKSLTIRLLSPGGATFTVHPATPPQDDYNAANPGVNLLTATAPSPANGEVDFIVELLSNNPS